MEYNLVTFGQLLVLYLFWVCGPLIPAVMIYHLFPNTTVAANGPLSGLTVRATGAFAAYIIVFLITYPLCLKLQDILGDLQRPVWTIKAKVIARDPEGNLIKYSNFYSGMTVSFSPNFQVIAGREVILKIPMDGAGKSWPKITFTIPSYGGTTIDLDDYKSDAEVDTYHKELKIHTVIPLERVTPQGIGYDPLVEK